MTMKKKKKMTKKKKKKMTRKKDYLCGLLS